MTRPPDREEFSPCDGEGYDYDRIQNIVCRPGPHIAQLGVVILVG
jgi:hypothetical protein